MALDIKHPLQHIWTLSYWHDNDWNSPSNICTIDSIEDFWRMYNNIPKLTKCDKPNFSFFHRDVRPVWEDKINVKGGKWIWEYPINERHILDKRWMTLLLLMIGETITEWQNEILGATIHARYAGDRMTLWTKNTNSKIQQKLGTALKKKMNITNSIIFKSHVDAITINSSFNSSAKIILT